MSDLGDWLLKKASAACARWQATCLALQQAGGMCIRVLQWCRCELCAYIVLPHTEAWRYANIVGAAIEVERVGGKQSGFDMVTHSKAT